MLCCFALYCFEYKLRAGKDLQSKKMSRRRTNAAAYTKLPSDYRTEHDKVDGFIDEQFRTPPRKFPWKAVVFIIAFLIAGAVCLTFGILTSTGYFDKQYEDRAWPLLILGILMFIPGGYYGYVLLCICLKRDGFTLDDVPSF